MEGCGRWGLNVRGLMILAESRPVMHGVNRVKKKRRECVDCTQYCLCMAVMLVLMLVSMLFGRVEEEEEKRSRCLALIVSTKGKKVRRYEKIENIEVGGRSTN